MAEGNDDFQARIASIENGYLVKRLGRVWFFGGIRMAIEQLEDLILEWEKDTPRPFQGGRP